MDRNNFICDEKGSRPRALQGALVAVEGMEGSVKKESCAVGTFNFKGSSKMVRVKTVGGGEKSQNSVRRLQRIFIRRKALRGVGRGVSSISTGHLHGWKGWRKANSRSVGRGN